MLRSSLLVASAAILCTAASAQQTIQAKKVLGPVRDAGIYHVATGTWTRGGSTSNISPTYIYRNDASSGYFGTGWDNCKGVDEIMIPGTTNPQSGPQETYTIDGMAFSYCKLGAGTIDWEFCFYDSYVPCDDPNTPASCICQLPEVYTFIGLPGGSACWILTVDLAGGYELCMSADGGVCNPQYQGGGLGLDFGAIGHRWTTTDGGTAGPFLNGNPSWDAPGGLTCYSPAPSCPGSEATGLGAQDVFAIGAATGCAVSPGCYFFGGYVNLNGCNTPSQTPLAQFGVQLFSDCTTTCVKGCGTVYCDEGTNPNNVADIAIDTCTLSVGSVNLSMSNGPLNQFGYPLLALGTGVVQNPPGAKGALCLAGMGAIGRYVKDIGSTGGTGTLSVDLLNAMTGGGGGGIPNPPGGTLAAGQTWNFQYWHRQPMQQPSSFSSAITVTFN
jgi:hypothetical protein